MRADLPRPRAYLARLIVTWLVAELSPGVVSDGPTAAVVVSTVPAGALIWTPIVSLVAWSARRASCLRQVVLCVPGTQDQSALPAASVISPAGRVTCTVVGTVVGPAPVLATSKRYRPA